MPYQLYTSFDQQDNICNRHTIISCKESCPHLLLFLIFHPTSYQIKIKRRKNLASIVSDERKSTALIDELKSFNRSSLKKAEPSHGAVENDFMSLKLIVPFIKHSESEDHLSSNSSF